MGLVGLAGIELFLVPMTEWFYEAGWLTSHSMDAMGAVGGGH